MPISPDVRERARGFLPARVEIRYIFPASRNESSFFVFAVTDAAVTVLVNRLLSRNRPKGIWAVFPRNVRIGPVDTHLVPTFHFGGHTFEVDDEYVSVINACDAELQGAASLPPDPLPDL
ncbi:hypothetical protein [Streptomonospora wellingtoniae]|uniref:Uncharacterized protein n=1 Tax=Streptomonospora wellingtoniae TaxID=3075544 RepID=A0ABU2KZY9_9ACTN|nr:hypothetical protein [Streptomonospora sp. DSM 45055]MDT0304870.1 hypothetical protein [Streptomonospora sp. DSM 45055]